MIKQTIEIVELEWDIYVLYECSCKDNEEIHNILKELNCSEDSRDEAMGNLGTCNDNIGMTYSNTQLRKSLVVISRTSSPQQLINTVTHEVYHLATLIGNVCNLSEEGCATLCGNLNMKMSNIIQKLI